MHMQLRKLGMMSICIPICRAMGTVIQSMEGNIAKKLQYLPERIKGMHVLGIDDTVVVDSGLPSDTFNTAYGGKVGDKTALDVMNYYQTKNYPMAWWIGPDTAKCPNHVSSLESAGFVHDEFDAGMFCRLDQMNAKDYQFPTDLKINFCTEPKHFNAFGNVLASIFDPVDEHVKQFYQMVSNVPAKDRQDIKLFVGYVDGRAVSTSALFLTDVAGVYDISTRPEMQRRGYGAAMTYTALKYAKDQGMQHAVLQASPDGLNIYKRFGFKEVCDFNVWSNKNTIRVNSV